MVYIFSLYLSIFDNCRENIHSGDLNSHGMSDDDEPASSLERVQKRKREAAPDVGYRLVEWDLMKPPAEQVGATSRWWLTLSAVSVPEATEFTDWSVFDQYVNDYTRKLTEMPENPDPESVSDAIATIEQGEVPDVRIALVRLRQLAESHPDACRPAVSVLTDLLPPADTAVQAEILGVLRVLADADPELVHGAVDAVGQFLSPDTRAEIRESAAGVVSRVAENDPAVVTGLVPKLAVLLDDTTGDTEIVLQVLTQIAAEHPDAVVPVVPRLTAYVKEPSGVHGVGALSVLGQISKAFPNAATDVVPVAHELLSADTDQL